MQLQEESFTAATESLVRYSKKKTQKYFDTTKTGEKAFIKASNVLLEPFSPLKRKQDHKAQKTFRIPPDPLCVTVRDGKQIPTLVEFCK